MDSWTRQIWIQREFTLTCQWITLITKSTVTLRSTCCYIPIGIGKWRVAIKVLPAIIVKVSVRCTFDRIDEHQSRQKDACRGDQMSKLKVRPHSIVDRCHALVQIRNITITSSKHAIGCHCQIVNGSWQAQRKCLQRAVC